LISAYAVLSNHYRLVLHVDQEKAQNWTSEQVVDRWINLTGDTLLAKQYKNNEPLEVFEIK